MLLEQLVEKGAQPPEYDWDSYYQWLFAEAAARDVSGFRFWQCNECLSVNVIFLPARYGKCRGCELIFIRS
jgi:hypothetical protein